MNIRTLAALAACLFLFLSSGCVEDRAEAEKRILAHDPSFRKVVDKRNSLREELARQKALLSKKRQDIADQVTVLRAKKDQAKKEYAASVEKIKRQLQPEKRQLERDLMEQERLYRKLKMELGENNRDIEEIGSLIKKKDQLTLTQEEIRTWNDRLASLIKKKDETYSEKQKTEEEIEVTKLKIKVINP